MNIILAAIEWNFKTTTTSCVKQISPSGRNDLTTWGLKSATKDILALFAITCVAD